MKALNLYSIQDLRYEDVYDPVIENSDDVIVKVKVAGICGSDLSRYKKLGPYVEGMTFGHEFSGEIVETGSGVKGLQIGDRVSGCPTFYCGKCESCKKGELSRCEKLTVIGARHPGSYAEYVKLPAENIIPIPDEVDFDTAAMIEPSAVVVHGMFRTSIQPGGSVAVMGCGNIGLLAVLWAKIFGAKTVYAIDIDDEKLKTASEIGADVLINPVNSPAYDQMMEHTNNKGVDVVVESAGSPVTSAQVFALAKKGGEVVFMGIPYADVNVKRFYFEKIVRSELTVLGSWNAISSPFPGREWQSTVHFMANGQLNVNPIITNRLNLREGPDVFDKAVNRKESFGKVLFYPELG